MHRPRTGLIAFLAALFAVPVASPGSLAAMPDDRPFGDAVELADAALDNQRGGFAVDDGSMLRFAVDLERTINGQTVASLSINNLDHGRITGMLQNFGRTIAVPLPAAGGPQTPPAGEQAPTVAPGSALPASPAGSLVPTNPVTSVASAGASVPVLPHPTNTVSPGQLLVTTGLLPNGNGVMTLIQNARSNVTIDTFQTLNIHLMGIDADLLRATAMTRGFAQALGSGIRR